MSNQYERALEREEAALEKQLANGEITSAEFNAAMRDLQRDYRDAANEAAERAHDEELDRW